MATTLLTIGPTHTLVAGITYALPVKQVVAEYTGSIETSSDGADWDSVSASPELLSGTFVKSAGGSTITLRVATASDSGGSGDGGSILSTSLTGTQHNLSLTPAKQVTLLCNNATDLTITGIDGTGWEEGSIITVISNGAGNVIFPHDTGSTVGNRINNRITGSRIITTYNGYLTLCRQTIGGTYYWLVKDHDQGTWLVPTFAAGDYTASGSMTWTVESGDATISYYIRGKSMTLAIRLATTSIGGTVSTQLFVKIPGGHVTSKLADIPAWLLLQGPIYEVGTLTAGSIANNLITVARLGGGNWVLSTNTTWVLGEITFELS